MFQGLTRSRDSRVLAVCHGVRISDVGERVDSSIKPQTHHTPEVDTSSPRTGGGGPVCRIGIISHST